MHWCLELGRRGRGLTRLAAVMVLLWPLGAAADELVMTDHAGLIRSLLPMVVNITAKAEVVDETSSVTAAAAQPSQSYRVMTMAGSGFVVDPDGVIVTNWHVVNGAFEIYVTFSDGTRAKAEILNAARIVDIALLKVSVGRKLAAVHWGDSEKVQIGDPVFAIGNPLGVGMSVSSGIVSALNRNIMDTPVRRFHPDRCRDQPRQLGRAAVRHEGRGDRGQHGADLARPPPPPGSASRSRPTTPASWSSACSTTAGCGPPGSA